MRATVKMPKVADTADNVIVSEIRCLSGAFVHQGDVLIVVETDKAIVEVPSPVSGQVARILVSVDEEVSTGSPIVLIDAGGKS